MNEFGPVLKMKGVRKRFAKGLATGCGGVAALDGVDIELRRNEVLAVVGAEASGKTALLQCACGLVRCDGGEVHWFGERFHGGGCVPGVSYIPAVPVFYPFLSVRDVLEYTAARDGASCPPRTGIIDGALNALRLDTIARHRVMSLSRSDIKRLAIANALVSSPVVMLIDTSTADLTGALSEAGREAIDNFCREGGAVMIATRDAASVASIASRVTVLSSGRIAGCFLPEADSSSRSPASTEGGVRFVAEMLH